jgi:hypothetical protein
MDRCVSSTTVRVVARSIVGSGSEAEPRRPALDALAELVPAHVLTWDRIDSPPEP